MFVGDISTANYTEQVPVDDNCPLGMKIKGIFCHKELDHSRVHTCDLHSGAPLTNLFRQVKHNKTTFAPEENWS